MMPLQRHIKNVVHNYTEAERKVREATSNDPWGPSSTLMSEIADRTYNVIAFTEIMQMIWRRLNDKSKNWRHVYKALILLEYIIKTGCDKVAVQCRENIHAIETLTEFYYVEEGKDVGAGVREKARSLNALLRDDERLAEERAKALLARERTMHGGAAASGLVFSPSTAAHFGRSTSAYSDERRPASQPSFSPSGGSSGLSRDLDSAQPQSYTEEQLQLQLALAISREEHERELQKRQEEEAREALKLQMVLEQSKREHQNQAASAAASSLLSDLNPLPLSSASSANNNAAGPSTSNGGGGGLFSLIDTSLSAAPANMPDPWSTTIVPAHQPTHVAATVSSSASISTNNNAHGKNGMGTGELLASAGVSLFDSLQVNNNATASLNSAWTPREVVQPRPVANNNPWAALDPLIPSSTTVTSTTVPSAFSAPSATAARNGNESSGGGNAFGSATEGGTGASSSAAATGGEAIPKAEETAGVTPTRKRTPADFLGDHKGLVDLEKLVDRNPERETIGTVKGASTNPFATSNRPLTAASLNPFSANQPPKPSLNQLSSAAMGSANGMASAPPLALLGPSHVPSAFSTFAFPSGVGGPFFPPPSPTMQGEPSVSAPAAGPSQQSLNPFF